MIGTPENRYQAFAIHLGISAVIFVVLSIFIVFIWYPGFLFQTDGGWAGIRLVAGVDFIIGPTLTLIVYKVGKPGLKFDLALIALTQIICLTIGTWIVHQERPIAIFYANEEFLAKSEIALKIHEVDTDIIRKFDNKSPAWIYIDLPEDETERIEVLKKQMVDGLIYSQVKRYRPFRENLDKIMQEAIDPATLDDSVKNQITENGKVYHYEARYGKGLIEIDKNTGEYINIH